MTTDDQMDDAYYVPPSDLDIAFHVLTQMLTPTQRLLINGPTSSGEFTVAVMSTERASRGKVTGGRGTFVEALLEAASKLGGING